MPRFIKLQDDIVCKAKVCRTPLRLPAGTKLEITSVETIKKYRYITCKAKGVSYLLREDIPINCTAVDDSANNNYTLKEIVGSMILPKTIMFSAVWPEFVNLLDDEQAQLLLILISGPLKIPSTLKQTLCVARMKQEIYRSRSVSLIPKLAWVNQRVTIKAFKDNSEKQEYVSNTYGDSIDSSFVENMLYHMRLAENCIIKLLVPRSGRDSKICTYLLKK